MTFDLSNPLVLIVGGIVLLALLFFWNQHNVKQTRKRRNRSFREGYYDRKKEREKESE